MQKKSKEKTDDRSAWKSGDYGDFLGLTDEERQIVEMRIAVSKAIRRLRAQRKMTQAELAQRVGSSQSRIARIEAGASDVTLDLLIRVMLAAGGSLADFGRLMMGAGEIENSDNPPATRPTGRKRQGTRKPTRVTTGRAT